MDLANLALVVKGAPVTGGVIRLVRTGAVYSLTATVDGADYRYGWSLTTKDLAEAHFDTEREALSCGMDITDPASGWVED